MDSTEGLYSIIMGNSPLNLAHFHERRAEKHLKLNRYNEALKAIEKSLFYIQEAYKIITIPTAIKVLETQKWEYTHKLTQIQIRKSQHERLKLKEMASQEANVILLKPESVHMESKSANAISSSIDNTIEDCDAKLSSNTDKENQNPGDHIQTHHKQDKHSDEISMEYSQTKGIKEDSGSELDVREDFPTLVPLELPAFDFDAFKPSQLNLYSA